MSVFTAVIIRLHFPDVPIKNRKKKKMKTRENCRENYSLFISRAIPASPKKVCSWELVNHDGPVPRTVLKSYLLAECTACIVASVAFAGWLHSLVC
jgi:hypothetical protein